MRCSKCQSWVGEADQFCQECGQPVPKTPAPIAPSGPRIITIGREVGNRLVINDPRISRHHASVQITPSGMIIEDLGSANGITVRGRKVPRAHFRLGDEIFLGSYPFNTRLLEPYLRPAPESLPPDAHVPSSSTLALPMVIGGVLVVGLLAAILIALGVGRRGVPARQEYLVLTETWNGAQIVRHLVTAEPQEMSQGKFVFRLAAANIQTPKGLISFSLGKGQPQVKVSTSHEHPIHQASLYYALARKLVKRTAVGGDEVSIPVQIPSGRGLKHLGKLKLRFKRDSAIRGNKKWTRVRVSSRRQNLASRKAGSPLPTRISGTFIWDEKRTTLAVADLWVEQLRDGTRAWSRISILLADPSGWAQSLLQDIRRQIYRPATVQGVPLGPKAMAELTLINRSVTMAAALEAEGAHNPVFLAVLGLVHLADAAYTFGANMGYDLAMMHQDPNHRFQPFDGQQESLLERYIYRNAAQGWAGLAAQLGLIGVEQVEGYAHWGGRLLHFVSDVAGGLGLDTILQAAVTTQGAHFAHQLWNLAAHASGAKKQGLVALGRLAYYLSKLGGQAIEAYDLYDTVRDACGLWRTRPWESDTEISEEGPGCRDRCPAKDRRECQGGGYRVCGNHDSDSCLEWGSVKSCGGDTRCVNGACVHGGEVKFTLTWDTNADIDLHVRPPCGGGIYYKKKSSCGGRLDVDDRCGNHHGAPGGPENIYWSPGRVREGEYVAYVHYYADCGSSGPTRYTVQISNGARVTTRTGVLRAPSGRGRRSLVEVYRFRR